MEFITSGKELQEILVQNKIFVSSQYTNFVVNELIEVAGARFYCDEEKQLYTLIHDIRLKIDSQEELDIALEIFSRKEYDFLYRNPYVLVDVGLNVGTAALYFAAKKNVVKVYGFEPFPETYKKALENLQINPELSRKVETHNIGLGSGHRIEKCAFDLQKKGCASIYNKNEGNEDQNLVEIKVEDAGQIFKEIIKLNPYHEIVVKMDCEGAEYEIFEDLCQQGILNKIRAFVMEWHQGKAEILTEQLEQFGYVCFTQRFPTTKMQTGLLFAVRI